MTDPDLLALCCFEEANLEPDDGVAAVARVILNRAEQKYESDGTILGTITRHSQFSWVNYAFSGGKYRIVAWTAEQVTARVAALMERAKESNLSWARCSRISAAVVEKNYAGGPQYQMLWPKALLYDNLAVSKPPWATPDKLITVIGHHSFYAA